MKYLLLILVSFSINAKDVIKSLDSDLCYITNQDQFTKLEDGSNTYPNLQDCLEDGGKLSPTLRKDIKADNKELAEELEASEKKGESNSNFYGINWGFGLAFTSLDADLIKDVTIEDGAIQVNHKVSSQAIAMIESHYFMSDEKKSYGHGPFMAIGLVGEDGIDPLSNYGVGWMWGWKTDDQGNSWNVGLGYFADSAASTLRDGLKDGDTTTVTDPNKLLKKSDESGWMLMFSANF